MTNVAASAGDHDLVAVARDAIERAEMAIAAVPDGGLQALFTRVDTLNQLRLELNRLAEDLKTEVEQGQAELVDRFTEMGTSEIGYGNRFGTLGSKLTARKIDPATRGEDIADALEADGLTALIQPRSYNHQSLSKYIRDLEEEGRPIPTNLAKLIEAYESWSIGFTTRRPTRARRRLAGAASSVLDGASHG